MEYALHELTQLYSLTGLHIITTPQKTTYKKTTSSNYISQPSDLSHHDISDKPQNQLNEKQKLTRSYKKQLSNPKSEKNHNNVNHLVLEFNKEKNYKTFIHRLKH